MRYSQYFNRKKGVRGHLWQGSFFSCILDERHLYSAIRYVENTLSGLILWGRLMSTGGQAPEAKLNEELPRCYRKIVIWRKRWRLSGVLRQKRRWTTRLCPIHKWLFSAISASDSDVRARSNVPLHTQCIPAVKIFVFLDLAENLEKRLRCFIPRPEAWEKLFLLMSNSICITALEEVFQY